MGVPVKARNTIKRGGVYIAPGTVFELPDQKGADYLIARGVVTPYIDKPIQATPEYEITAEGKEVETPPPVTKDDAPPDSFTEEPVGIRDLAAAKPENKGKRR